MKAKVALVALAVALLFQSCAFTRAFTHWGPNITDHKIFPHDEIYPSDSVFYFKSGDEKVFKNHLVKAYKRNKTDTVDLFLSDFIKTTPTTAFIIIKNDSILFEQYYKGYTRDSISKVFSVSKSITSLLTGIAVDEGYIESVHDPITKYIPELKKKDPNFETLTIEHLLNMRAGFKFKEVYASPFSKSTTLYYGTNQLGKLKRMKFKYDPGEKFSYQSVTTAALGLAVERAIGRPLGEYLQEKVWIPLGMENRATWDIDDKRHHSNKAHAGVNTTAIDLAKIGRLYLNNGNWNGKQIVSADWVTASTTVVPNNRNHHYQWWRHRIAIQNPSGSRDNKHHFAFFPDSTSALLYAKEKYPDWLEHVGVFPLNEEQYILEIYHPDLYYAQGIRDQFLFICPSKKMIIVRLGERDRYVDYPYLAAQIIRAIK